MLAQQQSVKTVLIAEDDDGIRDLVAFKLETAGYHTVITDNGLDAIKAIHEQEPDLVVLDVSMPGMDGLAICQEMQSSRPDIPVLMLSGRNDADAIALGYTAGADHYMIKPFSPADLVREVRSLLETGES